MLFGVKGEDGIGTWLSWRECTILNESVIRGEEGEKVLLGPSGGKVTDG